MPSEPVEYMGIVVAETDDGICINLGDDDVWFPRSQLRDEGDIDRHSEKGDEGTFLIPEWLAVEKGLE